MAGHVVTGAAVVLATQDGSERYLYRGASVGEGFTKESIKLAKDNGLIAVVKDEKTADQTDPYKAFSLEDAKAELAKRNEGRDEDSKIVPKAPGNKPEILAALVADDAKSGK